jgi:hypothetical protein
MAILNPFSLRPLLFLLLLTSLRGAVYIAAVPPWMNPDEPTHFEYAALLAKGGSWGVPRGDPALQREIILSLDRHRFWEFQGLPRPEPLPSSFSRTPLLKEVPTQIGRKPFLYYLLASFPLRLADASSLVFRLYCLRSLSLLFALLTVAVVYATARLLLPADPFFPFTAAAAASLIPQFILAGTSVGPDPLANLFCAGAVFLAAAFAIRGISSARLLAGVAVALLAVLTTYKSLMAVPPLLAGIVWGTFRRRAGRRWTAAIFALLLLVLLYSALIWAAPEAVGVVMARLSGLAKTFREWRGGDAPAAALVYPRFHRELFRSFWVKFGWARFSLPSWYYAITAAVSLIAAGGVVLFLIRRTGGVSGPGVIHPDRGERAEKSTVCLLLFSCFCALLAYYLSWGLASRTSTVQGRHLFPALSAWAVLFVLGWRELAPRGWRNPLYSSLVGLLALLDAVAVFGFIFPTFA